MRERAVELLQEEYNVSHETLILLESYISFLLEENDKLNLIGRNTMDDIWWRHILDSVQLLSFINNKDIPIIDVGTGAGIPGIILSIMGCKDVTLVDSIGKKIAFLAEAKRISVNKVTLINDRIENIAPTKGAIVISRAVASLDKLFFLCEDHIKSSSQTLFLKGKKYLLEINDAKKNWSFKYNTHQSITSNESRIIEIKSLHKCK